MECKTKNYWVPECNFLDEVVNKCDYPSRVHIHDLTLREGDQTPGCVLKADEKIELAKDLDDLGVDAIEMFAMVSGDDRIALTELSKPGVLKHAKIASLARALPGDVEAVAKCGVKEICLEGPGNFWIASNTINIKSEDEQIASFVNAIKQAKECGMERIAVGPWDCVRGTTMSFLERFVKSAVAAGATEICYADTFGFTLPWTVQYMIRKYREWAGEGVTIACHFHNDYGMATANTLAAVSAGCGSVQVSLNGLGERVGNTPLDEVALNLALNMNVKTDIKLEKLYPISKKIEEMTKIAIPENKPVVGERGFMMGSGLVVDMLAKAESMEMTTACLPFTSELVGRPHYDVVFGKGVGTNMVMNLITEMGLTATKQQAREISEMIKSESLTIKGLLPKFRVETLIREYFKNV